MYSYTYIYFCINNISLWKSKCPTEKSGGGGEWLDWTAYANYVTLSLFTSIFKSKKKNKMIEYFMVALIRYF